MQILQTHRGSLSISDPRVTAYLKVAYWRQPCFIKFTFRRLLMTAVVKGLNTFPKSSRRVITLL